MRATESPATLREDALTDLRSAEKLLLALPSSLQDSPEFSEARDVIRSLEKVLTTDSMEFGERALGEFVDSPSLQKIDNRLRSIRSSDLEPKKFLDYFDGLKEDAETILSDLRARFSVDKDSNDLKQHTRDYYLRTVREILNDYQLQVELGRLRAATEQAEASASRARESASKVRTITADAGADKLSEAFSRYSRGETIRASVWLTMLILAILAAVVVPVVALNTPSSPSLAQAITHAAAALPFLGLAAVFGHEVTSHTKSARIARLTAVELLTVDAFTEVLPEDKKDRILEQFSERIYVSVGDPKGESKAESTLPATQDALSLARQLIELLQKRANDAG